VSTSQLMDTTGAVPPSLFTALQLTDHAAGCVCNPVSLCNPAENPNTFV
jgi:hypothetical protein